MNSTPSGTQPIVDCLVDRKQQNKLAVAAKGGDMAALATLLTSARFLAKRIGMEMRSVALSADDAASIAFERFIVSLKKFDQAKADIFHFWYYQGRLAVLDELRNSRKVGGRQNHKFVLQYRADLEDELHLHGRTFLDIDKFAAKHGISTRRAQRIAVIAAARRSNVSLLLLESGEEWVADHGPRPNEVIESNEKSKLIMDQLDTLEERERQYLVAHFGLDGTDPKTLTEIAKKAGYCTERVRQVVEDALAKMKRKIANGGEGGIEQFLVASGADEVAEGG
jgi:RNA polymerase sigma factor (sigma-70 family)